MSALEKITMTSPPRRAARRAANGLGWFSLALGAAELFAARRVTRGLGVRGSETIVRAFGAREIAAGALCLSSRKRAGTWSRVAGDMLDLAALGAALRGSARKRNVTLALGFVAGATLLDVLTARELSKQRAGRIGELPDEATGFEEPRQRKHAPQVAPA